MAVKTKKAPARAGFSCYLGPNITGVIQHAAIYPVCRAEALALPEVALALSKAPGIADLIVDGEDLPQGLADVRKKGTVLYRAYRAVLK